MISRISRGRTFGTVLVDLDTHRVIEVLPDRQAETATRLYAHPPRNYPCEPRPRKSRMPAPPLVALLKRWRLADRFHVAKNLSEAVADLLARVLTELKAAASGEAPPAAQAEIPLPVEEWRPTPGTQVAQAISTRRAEREARYQQVESLHKQGLTSKELARRMVKSRANRSFLASPRSGS